VSTVAVPRSRTRYALPALGLVIVLGFVMALFVMPARSWIAQRQALASARERFAVYEDVNAALQDEVSELRSTQGTRDAIRSQLGYLLPNEKRVPLLDAPAASVELPARWPYSIVAGILSVRGERARANGTVQPLGPLQP
jgi:hypothetical protein